jgi:hypothetical protein
MFGLGLLVISALGIVAVLWATSRFRSMKLNVSFLAIVVGGLAFYPYAYRFSTSYASFQALCELPDRYQVIRTKPVDFVFLTRDEGSDCKAGPTVISRLPYAGFDCIGPTSAKTTGIFRFTKHQDWREGCGLDCFDSTTIDRSEVNYRTAYRQGYVSGAKRTINYGNGLVNTPDDEKLRFFDTVMLDADNEMAFTRSYTYYPYGNGWAKLLGAASGSAPSMSCRNNSMRWNVLDVYKPRAGA